MVRKHESISSRMVLHIEVNCIQVGRMRRRRNGRERWRITCRLLRCFSWSALRRKHQALRTLTTAIILKSSPPFSSFIRCFFPERKHHASHTLHHLLLSNKPPPLPSMDDMTNLLDDPSPLTTNRHAIGHGLCL